MDGCLEKGLRNAATNNQRDDLKEFVKFGAKINGQDSGKTQRTALHWAAIRKHHECYDVLLSEGAREDIKDSDGKTAIDYKSSTLTKNFS